MNVLSSAVCICKSFSSVHRYRRSCVLGEGRVLSCVCLSEWWHFVALSLEKWLFFGEVCWRNGKTVGQVSTLTNVLGKLFFFPSLLSCIRKRRHLYHMNGYWIQDALMSFIIFVWFEMNFNKYLFICCGMCLFFPAVHTVLLRLHLNLQRIFSYQESVPNNWQNIFPLTVYVCVLQGSCVCY